jgi:hypothetical protein
MLIASEATPCSLNTAHRATFETEEAPNTATNIVKLVSNLWSDDADVTEKALTDLADLCHQDGNLSRAINERKMREPGGPMAAVQVLKKHVDFRELQKRGIQAPPPWTCSCRFLPTKVIVGDMGGVEVILAGMRRHPKCASLQRTGCGAVASLLCKTKRNAERLVPEADGIAQQVIAAMKAHPENGDVQHCSCVALWNVCERADWHRPLIVVTSGAAAIACAMKERSDNPQVREAAQHAIRKLAGGLTHFCWSDKDRRAWTICCSKLHVSCVLMKLHGKVNCSDSSSEVQTGEKPAKTHFDKALLDMLDEHPDLQETTRFARFFAPACVTEHLTAMGCEDGRPAWTQLSCCHNDLACGAMNCKNWDRANVSLDAALGEAPKQPLNAVSRRTGPVQWARVAVKWSRRRTTTTPSERRTCAVC